MGNTDAGAYESWYVWLLRCINSLMYECVLLWVWVSVYASSKYISLMSFDTNYRSCFCFQTNSVGPQFSLCRDEKVKLIDGVLTFIDSLVNSYSKRTINYKSAISNGHLNWSACIILICLWKYFCISTLMKTRRIEHFFMIFTWSFKKTVGRQHKVFKWAMKENYTAACYTIEHSEVIRLPTLPQNDQIHCYSIVHTTACALFVLSLYLCIIEADWITMNYINS